MAVQGAPEVVARVRAVFDRGVTKPYAWRVAQLEALSGMLIEHRPRFEAALQSDLGKSPTESMVTEIAFLQQEVRHTLRHLRGWLRPERPLVSLTLQPAWASTVLEPLGVALIIAPWNYPLMLAVAPLIGALAAGDAAVLKPSELAPATAALLAELLPRTLDARAVAVVTGGVDETTALLRERFDLIFFTGSTRVGRIVMAAAAEHLTPVVLELGGKSPVYVDESADLDVAADRIAWGKFMNAGQTCIAPDYLLATPRVAKALVPRIEAATARMYGPDAIASDAYCRIVDTRQFDRLAPLLRDGVTAFGGRADRGALKIEPTVLTGIDGSEPVMAEEVFGPILPIIEVPDERAAIARVAAGEKPLSLAVFTRSRASRAAWLRGTSSGSIGFDIPVLHIAVSDIPFGGVGASGMGSYHGRRSVVAFSHEKAVLVKPTRPDTVRLLAPPWTGIKRTIFDRLTR